MEGEFNRECAEFGGCPPRFTVGEQWGAVMEQLRRGFKDGEEKSMQQQYEEVWGDLKKNEQVPRNSEKRKLLPYLEKALESVKKDLENHESNKPSLLGAKNWKKTKREKIQKQKCLHNALLACAALELASKRLNENQKKQATEGKAMSPERMYPAIPSAPPSYQETKTAQLPMYEIKGGQVEIEKVEAEGEDKSRVWDLHRQLEESERRVQEAVERVEKSLNEAKAGSQGASPSRTFDTPCIGGIGGGASVVTSTPWTAKWAQEKVAERQRGGKAQHRKEQAVAESEMEDSACAQTYQEEEEGVSEQGDDREDEFTHLYGKEFPCNYHWSADTR